MKVCGVELKGNDAILCVMSKSMGLIDISHIRVPKISINDAGDSEQMQRFQFTFKKLLEDYQIDRVAIKGRALKGKFAGGPVGFKLEAAIQLIDNVNCEILGSSHIKSTLAKAPMSIDFRDTGLKKFQEGAFQTAFSVLINE